MSRHVNGSQYRLTGIGPDVGVEKRLVDLYRHLYLTVKFRFNAPPPLRKSEKTCLLTAVSPKPPLPQRSARLLRMLYAPDSRAGKRGGKGATSPLSGARGFTLAKLLVAQAAFSGAAAGAGVSRGLPAQKATRRGVNPSEARKNFLDLGDVSAPLLRPLRGSLFPSPRSVCGGCDGYTLRLPLRCLPAC